MSDWLLTLLDLVATPGRLWSHLGFAICASLCLYNFVRAVALDAGTCPKPSNDSELKAVSRLQTLAVFSTLCHAVVDD